MRTMIIEWQRLVDNNGRTCDRCSCTGDATDIAFDKLKRCLYEAGIRVVLEKRAIDQAAFSENPIQSNKISIDGRTIEECLGFGTFFRSEK